jgi:queuosine precursor transporter
MNELLWVGLLFFNFLAILVVYRFFGVTGMCGWLVLSGIAANIQVVKLVELFGVSATLGNIVYAGSFLATDILSENHGKKDATRAVYLGFIGIVVFTVFMQFALWFTPAPDDFSHKSLTVVFSVLPRITVASLTAYVIAQMHDVWAFAFWKERFPGKKFLWFRNNASTVLSQLIDSVVFTGIAFWGVFPIAVFLEIILTTYLLKVIVAVLDTPFVYLSLSLSRGK